MSDELQFVVCPKVACWASHDKLKFVGLSEAYRTSSVGEPEKHDSIKGTVTCHHSCLNYLRISKRSKQNTDSRRHLRSSQKSQLQRHRAEYSMAQRWHSLSAHKRCEPARRAA